MNVIFTMVLAACAWSQATTAEQQLEKASKDPNVMDASVPRRDGPLTVVEEERGALLKTVTTRERHCEHDDGYIGGDMGRGGGRPIRRCWSEAPRTFQVFGDKQTVRVEDADAVAERRAGFGALIGGGIGLLGFLALFAGPIGWAIGIGSVLLGAAAGAVIGHATSPKKGEEYERVVNERSVEVSKK